MNKLRRWLTFSEDGPDSATMVLRWFALAAGIFVVGASLRFLWWRQSHCTSYLDEVVVKELPSNCALIPQPGLQLGSAPFIRYGREGNTWIFRVEPQTGNVAKLRYVTLRPGAQVAELRILPDDPEKAKLLVETRWDGPIRWPLLRPDYENWRSGWFGWPRWDWQHDFGHGQRLHLRGCTEAPTYSIGDIQLLLLADEKNYALMCFMPPQGKN